MPSIRSFDLNLLVLFDALYREGQLSAAAAAVGLSQPAASQALARLRDALGDPLFQRRGRGMAPTPLAETLAPTVREALRTLDLKLLALSAFDPARSDREFTIGLADIGESAFFPSFLALVHQAAPHVRLRSVTSQHIDIPTATLRGDVDLAFDFEPPDHPSLRSRALGSDELVVIARHGHPRVQGTISLPGFLAEPRVRLALSDERWKRLSVMLGMPTLGPELRNVVGIVSQLATVPAVVADTDALAVVPRSFAIVPAFVHRLQILPLPVPLAPVPVYAFWHESSDADAGHTWLRGFLREHFWRP